MSEFSQKNWLDALTKLYERASTDPVYRALCLANPLEAVKEVSDIELPPGNKFQFFDSRETYLYTFLLPPATNTLSAEDQRDQLIRWATYCTDFTGG